MAAFREHFVKSGSFSIDHSRAYGEAFEMRNTTDYETLGKADADQAQNVVENANQFVEYCQSYLATKGYQ